MKYWIEGKSENGYGHSGILLKGDSERILSVVKLDDHTVRFMEECDGVYSEIYSKKQALEMLEELKQYIIIS